MLIPTAWRLRLNKVYQKCVYYVKKFMAETSLHGLKFVADNSITVWERTFFLLSFIIATVTTASLISNIYAKWNETPVIIGINPKATSILGVPFPAITICNMNQAKLSLAGNYSQDSFEYAIIKSLCTPEADIKFNDSVINGLNSRRIRLPTFVATHSQRCESMLVACKFGSVEYPCQDIFRDVMTDEGICCVFNVLPPEFLYKINFTYVRDLSGGDDAVPVNWNPEDGYPNVLPKKYYPRPAVGTGISLGFTVILNAEVDDYLCSSTNGPGFKISLHNPIETPLVKETGLTVPIGFETRFRIDPILSEAMPNIRTVNRFDRKCIFNNEQNLLYYKVYTRRNCENECFARQYLDDCQCIPYNIPRIYENATVCTIKDNACLKRSNRNYISKPLSARLCRQTCFSGCFELSYLPDAFVGPLAQRNFSIPSEWLKNMSVDYMTKNIAIVHMYYRETVFNGDLKNVYIGFTEFLSNIGGVLGLFTGFSIISVAEIIYFACIRPQFDRQRPPSVEVKEIVKPADTQLYNNWMSSELRKPSSQPKLLINNKWKADIAYGN